MVEYFCVTCDAGPWGVEEKNPEGRRIYQIHIESGHMVEPFDRLKHESIKKVRVGEVSDIKPETDEQKEDRQKKQLEEYLEEGRANNSEEWVAEKLVELLIFVEHDISKPHLMKKLTRWCLRFRYNDALKLLPVIIKGVFEDYENMEKIRDIAFNLGRDDIKCIFDRSQIDEVAFWIMGAYHVKRIELTGDLLFFNGRFYDTRSVALIRRACRKIFTSSLNRDLTEVLRRIEDSCEVITWEEIEKSIHLKCMNNGIYNIKSGIYSEKYDPDYIILNEIPHDFIENGQWDEIEEIVKSIIQNKNDRESFYDFLSNCFHPYNGIDFQFGGVGPPGTGKSQLCYLAEMTIGKQNTNNAAVHQIAEDQTTQKQTALKMLNIDADLSGESILHLDVIKKWVTQDSFTVRGIYEQPVDFRPMSRLMFMANELFEITNPDDAEAIYERTHLIKIEHKFRGTNEQIKDVVRSRISSEQLSAFVSYLLKNSYDIWISQNIRHPMPFSQVQDNWNLFGNRIKEFIQKWIVVGSNERAESDEPYDRWLAYALDKGYHNKDKKKFKKIFDELMGSSPTVSRVDGEQMRVYHGFRVKNRREVEEDEKLTVDDTTPKKKKKERIGIADD